MNKKIYFIPLLLLVVLFTSCEETKEVSRYDNWELRNQVFMDSLQNEYDAKPDHGGLEYVNPLSNPEMRVYYKRIKNDGTGPLPLYTQEVSAFFRGSYINGDVFQQNFAGENPTAFDSPSVFMVGGTVWVDVIQQRMKVGDRFMMYIPWQMGYGKDDYTARGSTTTIPGCSSLIFDVQLEAIVD